MTLTTDLCRLCIWENRLPKDSRFTITPSRIGSKKSTNDLYTKYTNDSSVTNYENYSWTAARNVIWNSAYCPLVANNIILEVSEMKHIWFKYREKSTISAQLRRILMNGDGSWKIFKVKLADWDIEVRAETGRTKWQILGSSWRHAHDVYRSEVEDFNRCVMGGGDPLATGMDGLLATEICFGMLKSSSERKAVTLKELRRSM